MMQNADALREILHRIDHRGYPAYKDTQGVYQFQTKTKDGRKVSYFLAIDHVQGDPFASPSRVSVRILGQDAGFPRKLYENTEARVMLQDELLRGFGTALSRISFQTRGSGKSGLMSVTKPGQEVLERTACQIDPEQGDLILRMEVGFPAHGRTVDSRALEKMLFGLLPGCVGESLYASSLPEARLRQGYELSQNQKAIREQLGENGLVAFVANGSILPRKSGVSQLPMKEAVPFVSPRTLETEMNVPYGKPIRGMGIPKGVTLIVGGGYHGKSTLLEALERGVYNHIARDGREYVITEDSAVKLRAEDGRRVEQVDISMFIGDLPNGKDTHAFSTEDASGSTSQAAGMVEAMEAGSHTFLIDEDTSATNFMIRDELMQRVVSPDAEPITPFVNRVRQIYETQGISTILVAGSSGSYFQEADVILQMDRYVPVDITAKAKKAAEEFPANRENDLPVPPVRFHRVGQPVATNPRTKVKCVGMDTISIDRENIDVRYLEQLVDPEQLRMLGQLLVRLTRSGMDGRTDMCELVGMISGGFAERIPGRLVPVEQTDKISGSLADVRVQEVFAAINRYRSVRIKG